MQQFNSAWRKCRRTDILGAYLKDTGRFCVGGDQHCAEIKVMRKNDIFMLSRPGEKFAVWRIGRTQFIPMYCLKASHA